MLANLNTTFGLGKKFVFMFTLLCISHILHMCKITHLASPVRIKEINFLSGTFVFFHKMRRIRVYVDQEGWAFREAGELGHSNLFFFISETFLASLI